MAVVCAKPLFLHCRDVESGEPLGAYDDLLCTLRDVGCEPSRCCLHCFTGDEPTLRRVLDAGLCIGITGYICKRDRGEALRDALQALASERGGEVIARSVMLETDAPYMRPPDGSLKGGGFEGRAPVGGGGGGRGSVGGSGRGGGGGGGRGGGGGGGRVGGKAARGCRDSEPAMTVAVCRVVAECLGVQPAWLARLTSANAAAMFGFSPPPPLPSDGSSVRVPALLPAPAPAPTVANAESAPAVTVTAEPAPFDAGEPPSAPAAAGEVLASRPGVHARPRRPVPAFETEWVAADWHEACAPRTYSGFFLPLIFAGLGVGDAVVAPARHFGSHRVATSDDIRAAQPFWCGVFSRWPHWVRLIEESAAQGRLDRFIACGVSARCTSLLPMRCPAIADPWTHGAVPHLKPRAQNELLEAALGPEEVACFYASVSALFMPVEGG